MKLSVITLSTLLLGSVAFAQDATPAASPKKKASTEDRFKKYDKDKDGSITLEEFTKGAKDPEKATAAFKKKDKDSDGKLTLEEFAPAKKAAKEGTTEKESD